MRARVKYVSLCAVFIALMSVFSSCGIVEQKMTVSVPVQESARFEMPVQEMETTAMDELLVGLDDNLMCHVVADNKLAVYLPTWLSEDEMDGTDFCFSGNLVTVIGVCADREYFGNCGVEFPASIEEYVEFLEEYVPACGEFSKDSYGNLSSSCSVEAGDESTFQYIVAVQSAGCYWELVFACFGDEVDEYRDKFAWWASLIVPIDNFYEDTYIEEEVTPYFLGGGTVLCLPDTFTKMDSDGVSDFMLTDEQGIVIMGYRMDGAYFEGLGFSYPTTQEEFGQLVVESTGLAADLSQDSYGYLYKEHYSNIAGIEHFYYSVFMFGEDYCWEVDFICPSDVEEEYRGRFRYWASMMELDDRMLSEEAVMLTSETGLYRIEIPEDYFVLSADIDKDYFVERGFEPFTANVMLAYMKLRAAEMDYSDIVVFSEDFYGFFHVTIVSEIYETQEERMEHGDAVIEEMVDTYLSLGIPEEDILDVGVGHIADKPYVFVRGHVYRDDVDVWQYNVIHEEAKSGITLTFADMSEEEIARVMNSFELVQS